MGSTALAAAVPYLGQVTQSSHKGQWSTYKKEKRKKKEGNYMCCPQGLQEQYKQP